jgi:hypothetical protein
MPDISIVKKNLTIDEKSLLSSLFIENHNGIVQYNYNNIDDKYCYKIIRNPVLEKNFENIRVKSTEDVKVINDIVVLAIPKVNSCTTILVRCGNIFFTLHHTPYQIESLSLGVPTTIYDDFFNYLESEDIKLLDVLFITGDGSPFKEKALNKNIKINKIPFYFDVNQFTREPSVIGREAKSIFIMYIPFMDSMIIYGDEFTDTREPAVFLFQDVFNNRLGPEYVNLSEIIQNPKYIDNDSNIPNYFVNYDTFFSYILTIVFYNKLKTIFPTLPFVIKPLSYNYKVPPLIKSEIFEESENTENTENAKKKYLKYKKKYLILKNAIFSNTIL